MTVCYFTIYSFPAIDFSLTLRSAIVQPQHEKSRFSILMSFIPNKCAAHQNYPVTVRISILRILQRSKVLLLQIIPCRIVHKIARSLSTVKKPCISTNSKGEIGTSTEDSCSDNTEFRFCQTLNQRGISSGFVKDLYETVLLTKVLAKRVNVQVPLTLCGTIYTLLHKGQRINWVLAISWLCQFIHNQLHVLLCLLQGHSHQHAWLP